MNIRSLRLLRQHPDIWIALSLFVVALLTRIPFRSQILHHWDSVNFALALDEFNIRLHQPHPPGTFVVYIMLGRAINYFLHDPNASLVWISILSSGLAAVLTYVLGKRWFDRGLGLAAAALMLSSPLVWFHGEVALTYMPEFLWVLAIILLCAELRQGNQNILFLSALLMGLAGGIRPNTPVFLFPLWIFAARKFPLSKIALALVVMGAGVALWAVPLIVMSGGAGEYWKLALWWARQHTEESGSAYGVLEHGARFVAFTAYCVGVGFLPVLWALWHRRCDLLRSLRNDWRAQLLAVWVLPASAYFVFVHLKQAGHTFTIMPAFIILVSLAIASLRQVTRHGRRVWIVVVALVVVGNSLCFLLGPASLFGSSRMIFTPPTWAAIHEYDTGVTARLEAIRESFRPEDTVVLAAGRNYRLPDFYLQDFQLTSLSHELGDDVDSIILPEHVHTLVLFDDSVMPKLVTAPYLQTLPLVGGKSLRYIEWDRDQQVTLTKTTITVQDK